MSKLSNLMIFVAGVAIGSVVTWRLIDEKYKQLAQEEIDSVKEVFSRKHKPDISENKSNTPEPVVKPTSVKTYAAELRKEGYTNYSDMRTEEQKHAEEIEARKNAKPRVISPEEYGEDDEYNLIGVTWYADGVLADDGDEVIHNIDEIVGSDAVNHFGEYAEDAVYVVNDRLKAYYEILRVNETYADLIRENPYKAEM